MMVRLFKEQPDSNIQLSCTYAMQLIKSEVRAKQVLFTLKWFMQGTTAQQFTQCED